MPDRKSGPRTGAPEPPEGEIVVEPPTEVPKAIPGNPLLRLVPALMVIAMVGMMALFVTSGTALARNPATLLFPAMMLVSAIGAMAHSGRGSTRAAEVDEGRKDYLRYLDRLRDDVTENASRQRESLLWHHPQPAALWTLVDTPRMWERGRDDADFCHIRVGVGDQRASVKVTASDVGPTDHLEPVGATALRNFVRTHSTVGEVPIAVAVTRFAAITVDGDVSACRALLRAMVCQLTTLQGPQFIALATAVDRESTGHWDWLKWLPHYVHLPFVSSQAQGRHTLVIFDGGEVGAVEDLLARADVTILGCGPHLSTERAHLRLNVFHDELAAVTDVHEVFARPDGLTLVQAEACARRLAPYPLAPHRSTATGDSGGWPALLDLGDLASIRPENLWQGLPSQNRLRVPIGVAADGSRVDVDLKEFAENGIGPHGLCVGATGSGKSELLRTLTLGLIATHSPELLNLVLVDFKGGATFLGFDCAPHVAAVITNLSNDAPLVARMRDALAGEVNRRQQILRSARKASVAEYEGARAAGAVLPPLPALLVVVDEFSELLSQHPDFAEMFVAIGRLGRSLRIHLLLATQRLDEGRLRGLDSHLSYRICLKTFSPNESRAAIGIPDAFHLPPAPGTALMKVGSNEPVAFQTAYVSAPCRPTEQPTQAPDSPAVQVFTLSSPVHSAAADSSHADATGPSSLETVLARVTGRGTPAHRVWLPPLAGSPSLDTLLPPDHSFSALTAPIGVVDKPFEQRRDPLLVELSGSAGNVAVVGAPQSGKSTAVRTLVMALSATCPPDQVQFYCFDFGGGGLSSLAALPHVGAVAGRADADLVRRTVADVGAILRSRETRFRELGIDSMDDYRRQRTTGQVRITDDPFGDVFLVIDGWSSLRDDFDALEVPISALAGRGLSFGVHLVLTASRWADIRPAVKDQIGTRIELRLGDPSDSELNRKAAQLVPPNRPGRGITRDGNHMLVALPRLDGRSDSTGLRAAIADATVTIKAQCGDREAPPVRLLPSRIDHEPLVRSNPVRVVIGVDEDELAPVAMDFDEHQHLLILGDRECGKTSTIRLICAELLRTTSPEQAQLMIVDYRRTLLGAVQSQHLSGYAMSPTALAAQLPALVDLLRKRIPGPDVDQGQLRTRSWWSGPDVYVIVDDYDLVVTQDGNPLVPLLELVSYARDLGLHVIIARRSGGAGRALFEPLVARVRELGCAGLMMSASPDEGILLGTARPTPLPPGRGRLVTRAGERIVQLGWIPSCQ